MKMVRNTLYTGKKVTQDTRRGVEMFSSRVLKTFQP